jgi:hypothetical protein
MEHPYTEDERVQSTAPRQVHVIAIQKEKLDTQ